MRHLIYTIAVRINGLANIRSMTIMQGYAMFLFLFVEFIEMYNTAVFIYSIPCDL